MKQYVIAITLLLTLALGPTLFAQNHGEAGIFADYFRQSDVGGTNFWGLGGRFAANIHEHVQLEAEMAYDFTRVFTEDFTNRATGTITVQRSSERILHALVGPKFQTGGGALRAFFTLKGGFMNFGFSNRPATFGTFSSSVADLRSSDINGVFYPGIGAEAFAGPFGVRFDIGDEIYFSNGAHNNLRITLGPQIRF